MYRLLEMCDPPGKEEVASLIRELLGILRRMHDLGFCHGDPNFGNILVEPANREFGFIDLHRSHGIRGQAPRSRAMDLAKMWHNLWYYYSEGEWFEMLQAYFGGDDGLERATRQAWSGLAEARKRRKIRELAEGSLRGRKTYARMQTPEHRVVWFREHDPAELIRAVRQGTADNAAFIILDDIHYQGRFSRLAGSVGRSKGMKRWCEHVADSARTVLPHLPVMLWEEKRKGLIHRSVIVAERDRSSPFAVLWRNPLLKYRPDRDP